MLLGLFALGAPRDPPYNIAFRCGRPSQSQTRVPFPGQASPWLDVGIWPGCPRGASFLTPSYADRSFPGQSPLCPDFGIWPGFPSGAFPLTLSVTDRTFPGQAPLWPDFGIWAAFPRGVSFLTHSYADRPIRARRFPA